MNKYLSIFRQESKNILFSTIGSIIFVVSIEFFLNPHNIFPIGIMGLSTELSTIINTLLNIEINPGFFYWLLNIPLLVLSWRKIGKKFTFKTLYVVTLVTILSAAISYDNQIIEDTFLSIIFSGVLSGISLGFLLRGGSSSGGVDVIGVYYAIFKGKTVGSVQIAFNTLVISIALLITKDFAIIVYMIVLISASSYTIDKFYNINEKYMLLIISKDHEKIKKDIYASQIRGITVIDSKGGYTDEKSNILIITVDKSEVLKFVNIVKKSDEKSFINILPVHNVVGRYETSFKQII